MTAPLCFPQKVLDQHLVMLGKTGAGKSSALRHIVEHLLTRGARVCVIDPKGDWWGLKSSADGKEAGFPVIAFGDFKESKATDIPINDRSGKHVAELVVSGNRPCIIGLRGWMPAAQARFWIDFASTIFNSNSSGGLHLVIDEIQNFGPKERTGFGDENMALHWTKRILAEGRGLGISVLCGSQRPQKVHNDVLTQCETLVAMRLVHPNDIAAVELWLSAASDKTKRAEILGSIADLARGEGWVWSPEIGFGPQRVKFPLFTTFDSFAPPQLQRKISASGWADVDLGAVREKLATVIEEAKANDPRELKVEIANLKKQLAAKPAASPEEVKVPVFNQDDRRMLASLSENIRHQAGLLQTLTNLIPSSQRQIATLTERVAGVEKPVCVIRPQVRTIQMRSNPHAPTPLKDSSQHIIVDGGAVEIGSGGKRRILIALAQYTDGMGTRRLSLLTGISASGGTWRTYLGELRSAGYVAGGGERMTITDAGRAALGYYDPLPTGAALRDYWRQRLGDSGKRRIFDVVVGAYPRALSYEEVSRETGIDTNGGTWRTYLGELRGLELIEGRGDLKACDDLFD